MQMRDFFQKIEIIILFYTLHLTCVQIFAEIGRFTAEILGGGGHNAPPPGRSKTSNSPALLGLTNFLKKVRGIEPPSPTVLQART